MIGVLCEHVKFDMILFTFNVIFQIKIFFKKNIDSKIHFAPQKEPTLSSSWTKGGKGLVRVS